MGKNTIFFLENSGATSEGVIFNIDFNENSTNPKYKKFVEEYTKKNIMLLLHCSLLKLMS